MQGLDVHLLLAVNAWVGLFPGFDKWVGYVSDTNVLKMLPLVTTLCVFWAGAQGDRKVEVRSKVLLVLFASLVALALARLLSSVAPYSPRPLHVQDLSLVLIRGMSPADFRGWSSFPSDNATFVVAVATGIALLNRRVGLWALLHAVVLVCLPRLYLSLHFPSDLIVGAGIGALVVLLSFRQQRMHRMSQIAMKWSNSHPRSFYALLFILVEQMTEMFLGLREIINFMQQLSFSIN